MYSRVSSVPVTERPRSIRSNLRETVSPAVSGFVGSQARELPQKESPTRASSTLMTGLHSTSRYFAHASLSAA